MHREQFEIEPDMMRFRRILLLVDLELGRQFERRETDLVRCAFLVLFLEWNWTVGRRGLFVVRREATQAQAGDYPGLSAFGDSLDDLKEPDGCEAGEVWSDRLGRLRDQQCYHAERL